MSDEIAVPSRFAEWAFEYRLGYSDGLNKPDGSKQPPLFNPRSSLRSAAYKAGRDLGRKQRKSSFHNTVGGRARPDLATALERVFGRSSPTTENPTND